MFTPKKKAKSLKKIFLLTVLILLGGISAIYFLAPRAEEAQALPSPTVHYAQNGTPADIPPASPTPKKEVSVRAILQNVLSLWTEALLSGDFKQFHQSLAPAWKAQDSPQDLLAIYRPLSGHKEALERFPERGKLVLLESSPFTLGQEHRPDNAILRENVGPESPWLVRGEWRAGNTTLNFTLILAQDQDTWKPVGLQVEIYER
jgi:hypothetical protein